MIFGTDTSKYQRDGTYDPGAFEIVNAEDPTMPTKVQREALNGRPAGLYVWVYPGEPGHSMVNRAQAALARAGAPCELGVWWDYEDRGVAQWQLADVFQAADAVGLWSGYYSNAGTVDHGPLMNRAWWLAAYPGANDGSFPGLGQMRAPRPVNIWQYSSSQGSLDRNVIVDDGWYSQKIGADMALSPEDLATLAQWHQDDRKVIIDAVAKMVDDKLGVWMQQQSANTVAAVAAHVDEKIAALPAVAAQSLDTEALRSLVREELDKTKLVG